MTSFLWIWPQIHYPNKSSEEEKLAVLYGDLSVRKMGRTMIKVNVAIGGLEVNGRSYSVVRYGEAKV